MKKKVKKPLKFLILTVLLSQSSGLLSNEITVSYKRIIEPLHLEKIISVNNSVRSSLVFRIKLTPQDPDYDFKSLEVKFKSNEKWHIVKPSKFGAIELPLSEHIYAVNPSIHFSKAPPGGFKLGVELAIRQRPPTNSNRMVVEKIQEAYNQYNSTITSVGMIARMFAPKINYVILRTKSPQQDCNLSYGEEGLNIGRTNSDGELRFPIEMIKEPHSEAIICSQAILEVLFETS